MTSRPEHKASRVEQTRRDQRSQENLDREQAISDLEQSVGDRDQAVGDIEQDRIDRVEAERETDHVNPTSLGPTERLRVEHGRLDLARAQERRRAHQEQLDRTQAGRDERQDVLESQQATIDDPRLESNVPSEADLVREAERRSRAAVERAEAATSRAQQAIERAKEAHQRIEASRRRRTDSER